MIGHVVAMSNEGAITARIACPGCGSKYDRRAQWVKAGDRTCYRCQTNNQGSNDMSHITSSRNPIAKPALDALKAREARERLFRWAGRHLEALPEVHRTTVHGDTALEVGADDGRLYTLSLDIDGPAAGWTCVTNGNIDEWTEADTAVGAYQGERAADVAFRGGPLERSATA